jgi:hypothetical protein
VAYHEAASPETKNRCETTLARVADVGKRVLGYWKVILRRQKGMPSVRGLCLAVQTTFVRRQQSGEGRKEGSKHFAKASAAEARTNMASLFGRGKHDRNASRTR